ncbi:MAG TPA: hypothetical protein VND45_08110 [Thermoanaerobaculia bacterium]|nr:hypothetical protein [Thermoanaerobaculia bacterium]
MKETAMLLLLVTLVATPSASALQNEDLVAMAAMPLAVAAVSELTDVPADQLIDAVTLMNDAQVPAAQFVEVLRYAPLALADTSEPFVPYLTSQVERGVRGEALALAIEQRIERYDGADAIDVARAPRLVTVDDDFYPEVVATRFAHPHGGPPGQLKKERDLQTGAEVVHETRVAHVKPRVKHEAQHEAKQEKPEAKQEKHEAKVEREDHGKGNGKAHGNGGGHGKGKGKGKG